MTTSYRVTFFLVLFFTVFSCQQNPTLKNLNELEGYWEITSVETKNEKTVNYKFNETVDYFEVTDSTGVRTKVKPRLDGSFIKSNDAEGFTASITNDKLILEYSTNFDTWNEEVLYLDSSTLKTRNDRGITYTYRRFTGYLDDGKTQ